jgi:pseudouridine kinase
VRIEQIKASLGRSNVVVVGGANTDIVGVSDATLIPRDSNPGHVRIAHGGVGRNIAENLARLGARTSLITVFGSDRASTELAFGCERAGIDTSASLRSEAAGSHYLAIAGPDGDMELALNDMRSLELLTPEYLQREAAATALASATLVVIDANLTEPAIAHVLETTSVPVLADAVSAAKVGRLADSLDHLAVLKANALEASVLLGEDIDDSESARQAAEALLDRGVGEVYLTLGALGSTHTSSAGTAVLPRAPVEPISTTGAGDAFTAGVAVASLAALPQREGLAFATALAGRTMAVETSVDPGLDLEVVIHSAEEMLS